MKFPVVEDWKRFPTWASTWAGVALGTWATLPEAKQIELVGAFVPPQYVAPVLVLSLFVGRLWKQK